MNRKNNKLILAIFLGIIFAYPPSGCAADEAQASQIPPAAGPQVPVAVPESSLTLELQGVNILDVFKLLSKKSGLNIVAGKNVQGQVSIFLQNVPVQEALKTILQSQGLAGVEEKGIIKVMTEEEYRQKYGRPYEDQRITKAFHLKYASSETLAGKLSELKSTAGKILTDSRTNSVLITELPQVLADMEKVIHETDEAQATEAFQLRFARAEDLEPKLKSIMEGSAGKLEIDKRSNRVIVMDIPSRIEKMRSLIDSLDMPVPQVLIEAKIVEVRLSDSFRQGINWQDIMNQVGRFDTLKTAIPLAVVPPAGAVALTTLALGPETENLSVVLSLLEQVGKTNLLSSPRITVQDNEEAKLAVATKQPFVSQTVVQTVNSTNTADNVQFIDVGVTLKVRPRISRDDYVEMKIMPEVSSSNQTVELEGVAQGSNTAFTRTRIPVVTTQQLETTVQIKSGVTLIIGGLIQEHQEKETSKVPIVGSIPLLGRLFQSKAHDFTKTELVTFLTPTIIKPSQGMKGEERFAAKDGSILPFDEFAGHPFLNSYADLKRYAQTGEMPYWEKRESHAVQ